MQTVSPTLLPKQREGDVGDPTNFTYELKISRICVEEEAEGLRSRFGVPVDRKDGAGAGAKISANALLVSPGNKLRLILK